MPDVRIDESVTPAAHRAGLIAALEARRVDNRFHYIGDLAASRWRSLATSHSPAHDANDGVRAYDDAARHDPLVLGDWLQPGTHLDLIGAYRPDMREADDDALTRARIFVDARATTVDHIGELKDPIARGVISESDVVADFYDLAKGTYDRRGPDEITLAKNGGGAHLDLMTAAYILRAWRGR